MRNVLRVAALLIQAGSAPVLVAQAPPTTNGDPGHSNFQLWGSLSLGPSVQAHGEPVAGNLALWSTYHSIAFSVRSSGVSDLDLGGRSDKSVLIGRGFSSRYSTTVLGVGAGVAQRSREFQNFPKARVLAVGAESDLTLPFAGIGVSAFGAFGSNNMAFGGVCLTLALGYFR